MPCHRSGRIVFLEWNLPWNRKLAFEPQNLPESGQLLSMITHLYGVASGQNPRRLSSASHDLNKIPPRPASWQFLLGDCSTQMDQTVLSAAAAQAVSGDAVGIRLRRWPGHGRGGPARCHTYRAIACRSPACTRPGPRHRGSPSCRRAGPASTAPWRGRRSLVGSGTSSDCTGRGGGAGREASCPRLRWAQSAKAAG